MDVSDPAGSTLASAFESVLPYVASASAAGIAGGVAAVFWKPGLELTSYIQHFTAGVVIAAVALEVTPEILRSDAAPPVLLGGFVAGGLVMLGVKWLTLEMEARRRRRDAVPWGLTAAAAVDTLLDGTIIGAGFAMSDTVGGVLALSLGLELLCLTLSVGAAFRPKKKSAGMRVAVTSGISLLLPLGAWIGLLLLRGSSGGRLAVALSFGAAALLYLVTEELLIETRLPEETLLSTAMFFLGFLAIFALVSFGGR